MDPFEAIEVVHLGYDVREWWEGPHDYLGRGVRVVAGPATFDRLPERFRTKEAAQDALFESRLARSSGSRPGEYVPRVVAFLPGGLDYRYTIEAAPVAGSAKIMVCSESGASLSQELPSYAADFRNSSDLASGQLEAGPAFGQPGLVGRFVRSAEPGTTYVDRYCRVGHRSYRALCALAEPGNADLNGQATSFVDSVQAGLREQPELRRVSGDLTCVVPPGWLVSDTLQITTPEPDAAIAVTSVPVGAHDNLGEAVDRHSAQLRELPEVAQIELERTRVLGGRDGIRRLFRFRSSTGVMLGALAYYYIEMGRLYCAVATVPAGSVWDAKIGVVMTRLAVV